MTKGYLTERRKRNLALAAKDQQHRCGICKSVLPVKVFVRWGDPRMYCSQACLDQAIQESA